MAFSSSTVSIGHSTKKSDYDLVLDNTIYLKSEAAIFTGTKTFQSGTVFEIKPKLDGIQTRSATGSVSIECEYLSSAGNSVVNLKTKIIDIGDWNMNTTTNVSINHGLTHSNIRGINVLIRNDATPVILYDFKGNRSTADISNTQIYISETTITLRRATDGIFDSSAFEDISYNRGWMTVQYID